MAEKTPANPPAKMISPSVPPSVISPITAPASVEEPLGVRRREREHAHREPPARAARDEPGRDAGRADGDRGAQQPGGGRAGRGGRAVAPADDGGDAGQDDRRAERDQQHPRDPRRSRGAGGAVWTIRRSADEPALAQRRDDTAAAPERGPGELAERPLRLARVGVVLCRARLSRSISSRWRTTVSWSASSSAVLPESQSQPGGRGRRGARTASGGRPSRRRYRAPSGGPVR